MTRDITKRLGAIESGGFGNIENHPAYRDLNWDAVLKKVSIAPFIPDSKKANFDATHELEELLLEDHPLKAKPRKKNGVIVERKRTFFHS